MTVSAIGVSEPGRCSFISATLVFMGCIFNFTFPPTKKKHKSFLAYFLKHTADKNSQQSRHIMREGNSKPKQTSRYIEVNH